MRVNELKLLLRDFVEAYPAQARGNDWWRSPLLATARADERFRLLREVAASDHFLPWDLLPSVKSVIVFFVPFREELAAENSPGATPSRSWGRAYVETNALIQAIGERIGTSLDAQGYRCALTPATHNFDQVKLMSQWSHKHLAHLVGLGRFGHNAQLITPSGCAGRLGSLVTEADLGDSPLMGDKEACLHKNGKQCLMCVERCPVQALTDVGFDRVRCWARLRSNRRECEEFADFPETTHVCGKCAVGVPCSLRDPSAFGSSRRLSKRGHDRAE